MIGLRGGAPREFLVGFGICALAMAGIFCAEWALGAIEVKAVRPEIVTLAANFGFLVLLWAPFEETLRALMLNGMRVVFRRTWIAVALVSVVFGLIHAANDHATALSVTSNALGGGSCTPWPSSGRTVSGCRSGCTPPGTSSKGHSSGSR